MTDRELMQQALDALNLELPSGAYLELKNALRDRLAQPEQDFDAIAERQLASLKRATRLTLEDAMVRAVQKMADESQPQRKPLTDKEILDAFCVSPGLHQFVQAFKAGVCFAEAAHGIKP